MLAACISAIGGVFGMISGFFAALARRSIFRSGVQAQQSADNAATLATVQAERQADVDAPSTKAAVMSSLNKGQL
jgi:predicted lipid-binding transport protein (Tim44 family)